ncbi:hypothetical protein AMATHDRAFT_45727 [Amanita thiersii Skay4041]|uniref:Enoyl-CoA hydratase n=1 Tax=Amanita thiersii Skay4041 TaxID=703135 RepID=A0A2A9NXH0_9AGAR|nr:hypothetical protein AMATHDRAFT_45727 [Amanita thiersii Skay4041]
MSYPLGYPAQNPLVTLTHPKPTLWVIELHNGQDSRLTVDLVDRALKPALDAVEKHWRGNWRKAQAEKDKEGGKGALIIVGKKDQDKFFSNGLDFANVLKDSNFFACTFNPLLTRLLTFPLPIIAAINGHCFAGGLMLAFACDYRVMTDGSKRNAWLTMNEVHFGAVWPLSFATIVRAKFGDHRLQRKIALEGYRYTPPEALADGLLDHIVSGGTAEVLAKAEQVADVISANAQGGVWGLIKREMYRDTLKDISQDYRVVHAHIDDAAVKAKL